MSVINKRIAGETDLISRRSSRTRKGWVVKCNSGLVSCHSWMMWSRVKNGMILVTLKESESKEYILSLMFYRTLRMVNHFIHHFIL